MNKLSIIATLMLATLVISIVPVFAIITVPHNADAMWIDHAPFPNAQFNYDTSTPVGTLFNVTVALNMTETTFAWQTVMYYNHTQLNATKVYKTAPPTSEFFAGFATTFSSGINTGAYPPIGDLQSVLASETLSSPDVQPGPHWGTLFTVTFNMTLAVPKNQVFQSAFNISYEQGLTNTYVWDPAGLPIQFTSYDGSYSYTWLAPTTKPYMGIEGPSAWPLTYGPGPAVGETFDAKVYVKMIDPAWFLNNVTFTLSWNNTVIDVLGAPGANFTLAADFATQVITNTWGAGTWTFSANYTGTAPPLVAGQKVLVATLHFTVMTQQTAPPASTLAFDESYLTFTGVVFWDHAREITADTSEQGHVIVGAFIVLKLPWLQVDPAIAYVGPNPMIGDIICVNVDVKNLTKQWKTVAIQFRLQYDDTVLQLVSVTEGPFMKNPVWNLYGTFFTSIDNVGGDLTYPFTHVLVLDLLFPNTDTGIYDQTTFPNAPQTPTAETPDVDPAMATFCFKVLVQNCFGGANITTALNILPFWPPTDDNFVDKDANYIQDLPGVNGTVVIQALNFVGRQIDLYGGAVNDGYGVLVGSPYLQFPAPYGGQGANHWMDIVFPQSQVFLNANVTYNYWPVQSKDVGWEIEGPFTKLPNGTLVPAQRYQIWAKFSSITDSNGVATLTYRMPWPCDDPDGITGIWKITATATVADQEIMDTTIFYYQRVVYITSVTTEFPSYYHGDCVKVTVNYQTHSVMSYPALFSIVLTDELGVPFGMALYSTTVGGATFCTWKNSTFNVDVCIPKWAYAGNGAVHVAVYDKDPTIGGQPWQSEYKPDPIINIYPYSR
jgi:hypothetical protein